MSTRRVLKSFRWKSVTDQSYAKEAASFWVYRQSVLTGADSANSASDRDRYEILFRSAIIYRCVGATDSR
jgi:hypothetical protein